MAKFSNIENEEEWSEYQKTFNKIQIGNGNQELINKMATIILEKSLKTLEPISKETKTTILNPANIRIGTDGSCRETNWGSRMWSNEET